jgi:hypothetical protein
MKAVYVLVVSFYLIIFIKIRAIYSLLYKENAMFTVIF